jgi:hypothetical protein
MFVRCSDYYASLTQEERSGLSRNDFTLGRPAMKTLFDSEDYMRNYYEELLDTISHNKEIISLEKKRMNGTTFWVCSYQTYKTKTDSAGAVTTEFTGEGRIYTNITKGILYQVTVYSLGAYLDETPDAVKTAESFTVGRLKKFGSVFIWIFIIAALGAVAVTILMQLDIIGYEEEEEVETLGLTNETIGATIKSTKMNSLPKKSILRWAASARKNTTKLLKRQSWPPRRRRRRANTRLKNYTTKNNSGAAHGRCGTQGI